MKEINETNYGKRADRLSELLTEALKQLSEGTEAWFRDEIPSLVGTDETELAELGIRPYAADGAKTVMTDEERAERAAYLFSNAVNELRESAEDWFRDEVLGLVGTDEAELKSLGLSVIS